MTPVLAMQWSSQQVVQWRQVQESRSKFVTRHDQTNQTGVDKWVVPHEGFLKVNVDASVFKDNP